jgi:hypothetical protein
MENTPFAAVVRLWIRQVFGQTEERNEMKLTLAAMRTPTAVMYVMDLSEEPVINARVSANCSPDVK